jgi:hypothetical protein
VLRYFDAFFVCLQILMIFVRMEPRRPNPNQQHYNMLGDVVAQLAKARLGEPGCNAAVPGSIPASPTVS